MNFTQEQKEFWDENGYLVVESVLAPPEIEMLAMPSQPVWA